MTSVRQTRVKLINGCEYDAFSRKARRLIVSMGKAGKRKAIKRGYNRRVRRTACDDLDAFIDATNRALTKHFGPDHQRILGSAGRLIAAFDW